MQNRFVRIVKSIICMFFFLLISTVSSFILTDGGTGKESVIMLYLLGVMFTTVITNSYIFGVLCAACGVLLFNYFFALPYHSLNIDSRTDAILLVFFFITAIVTGSLMSRLQKQKQIANNNEKTAKQLSEISGSFLHLTGKDNIIQYGIKFIYERSGCKSIITLSDQSVYRNQEYLIDPNDHISEYTIEGTVSVLGVITIHSTSQEVLQRNELLFRAVAEQMGNALNREYFYDQREEIRLAMEKEKLRSTLLRAVAHDLRSPLTALSGASSLLADSFDELSIIEKKELASTISDEMIWLTNLVENILNMTRINESKLVLNKNYEVVDDVVGEAVSHMKRLFNQRKFTVSLPSDVVAAPMDGKMIAQVIINLLDNAVKHTSQDDSISLKVETLDHVVKFIVYDSGEEIPEKIKDKIFNGFVHSENATVDGKNGMGLGLAICKAIVEAHNGKIWLLNSDGTGTTFIFTLPMEDISYGD